MTGENKSGRTVPLVDVVSWDANNFYVRCPYCEGIHRHGLRSYGRASRVSHCGSLGSYEYTFPFDEGTQRVAYEIDKSKTRFINTCTRQDLDEESDEDEHLASEFSSKAKISDGESENNLEGNLDICEAAQEMETIEIPGDEDFEEKIILRAIENCVNGNISWVKEYLQESRDAPVFLHGRDRYGNTTLILASMEQTSEMVSLLIGSGANVNAVNHDGRSALMEATLWGRVGNARLLLERGADKSFKDRTRRNAVDLAQPALKNQTERHHRAGGDFSGDACYKEDTFRRDADRKEILGLLRGCTDKRKTVLGAPANRFEFKDYSFRRSPTGQSIIFRGPISHTNVTRLYKAVARLERGGQFPPITAMSGWSHDASASYLSGKVWTKEVRRMADEVGHVLTAHPDDWGVPGRVYASHAEKQLIAYFISRHAFLPSEKVSNNRLQDLIENESNRADESYWSSAVVRALFCLANEKRALELKLFRQEDLLLGDEYDEEKIKELRADIQNVTRNMSSLELNQKMIELWRRRPPVSLKCAFILITAYKYTICDDCRAFLDRVNSVLGLSIELVECTDK